MESTKPKAKELQEFFKISLFNPPGSSRCENLYVQKGLVPAISELAKKYEAQLKKILEPRPFVKPIFRRKHRPVARAKQPDPSFSIHPNGSCMDDGNQNMEAARCLPTPPYEQDQAPSPFMQVPNLYEDLDGIAEVAPESPALPGSRITPSTAAESTNKLDKSCRKLTARKRTSSTCHPDSDSDLEIKPCSVNLEDLGTLHPKKTKRLLRVYYSKNANAPQRRSSYSTECSNTTDETENRLVPPLIIRIPKSKPKVQDVVGRIAICPFTTIADEHETTVVHSDNLQDIGSLANFLAPGASHSQCSLKTDEPPYKKMAFPHGTSNLPKPPKTSPSPEAKKNVAHKPDELPCPNTSFLDGLLDSMSIPPHLPLSTPVARQYRVRKQDNPPSKTMAFPHGTACTPPPVQSRPSLEFTKTGVQQPVPLKGILATTRNISRKKPGRIQFLPYVNYEGTGQLLSLPLDVVPLCEFNVSTKTVVPLHLKCHKEVNLKDITLLSVVCIQCNITFASRMELSSHVLVNHSRVDV